MLRSSSVPRYKTYSDSNISQNELPIIERKPYFSSSRVPRYDNRRIDDDYRALLYNKDVSNVINILNNNLNNSLKERNRITQEQINAIENNYYEIKYLLDNRINKLEHNQKKYLIL